MKNEFNFLDLKSNDYLSGLKKNDLNEFLNQLLNYKLHLRRELGIDKELTFGLELEFEHIKDKSLMEDDFHKLNLHEGIVKSINNKLHLWILDNDSSLKQTDGKEIDSPILIDKEEYWKDLNKICTFIKKNARIDSKCAGHVHIGSQILKYNSKYLMNFIKLWAVYENILYRYGYNEYLNKLEGIYFCNPAREKFLKDYDFLQNSHIDNIDEMLNVLAVRPLAVNLLHLSGLTKNGFIANKDTIEFRSPNGTLDPVIWQNNVNTFVKLLLYSTSNNFDMDTILKRENDNKIGLLSEYSKICLEQSLELSDLIFDNNLDKIYFLRQYIKNNEESNIQMQRTKKFTA